MQMHTPRFSPAGLVRSKIALLILLILALGWTLTVANEYRTTRKPIDQLKAVPPPLANALPKKPPTFALAVYASEGSVLAGPTGVAVSPDGSRIYGIQGDGNRSIVVFDRSGRRVAELTPPNTTASSRLPLYAAVDPSGVLYVSDRLRGVIDVYEPSGEYRGVYKPPENAPQAPLAIAFDRSGNFYVTDVPQGQHRFLEYDPDGQLKLTVGKEGNRPAEFSFPNGIATDKKGNIYVADSNNGRVQIFSGDGRLVDVIGRGGKGALGNPRGVVVDDAGRLFIVDMLNSNVDVWDVTGEPKRLYAVGSEGVGNGQLSYPTSVAVDGVGRVYVADRANSRLQVWSY